MGLGVFSTLAVQGMTVVRDLLFLPVPREFYSKIFAFAGLWQKEPRRKCEEGEGRMGAREEVK